MQLGQTKRSYVPVSGGHQGTVRGGGEGQGQGRAAAAQDKGNRERVYTQDTQTRADSYTGHLGKETREARGAGFSREGSGWLERGQEADFIISPTIPYHL